MLNLPKIQYLEKFNMYLSIFLKNLNNLYRDWINAIPLDASLSCFQNQEKLSPHLLHHLLHHLLESSKFLEEKKMESGNFGVGDIRKWTKSESIYKRKQQVL